MTAQRRNWIVAIVLLVLVAAAGLTIAASRLARRIEPAAREAAINYLSARFDSDVQLQSLHVRLPKKSLLEVVLARGRGTTLRVEGEGLSLRLKTQPNPQPLFTIRKFHCDVGLDTLLHPPAIVSEVVVDGMDIQVPPREARPRLSSPRTPPSDTPGSGSAYSVNIQKVLIQNAALVLQPRDPRRVPLRFEIQALHLESVSAGAPMRYDASLTNAKPPGKIRSSGTFGPWSAADPGETPIAGKYTFDKADLGVFAGIAGTLDSTGEFEGQLSALNVHGQASVPNFRLRISGNPVPLTTTFTALVDGTNGNTILQPVSATLGSTRFTTSGGVIQHEANQPRAISLNVSMPNGNLHDVLRLAMKGSPFMEGRLALKTRIDIPPLAGKVREKIMLDGHFELLEGRFLHSTIQQQIAGLSKRARGQSQQEDTDPVVSHMEGAFHLENSAIRFNRLSFGVPGADLDLAGDYSLNTDQLDFTGALKLQARVSQLVGGWKGVLLRPVDPFFEKEGAGTFLHTRVEGTSKAPKFIVVVAGHALTAPLPKHK